MVSITLERLWMFSDRIVDFQFFVNFHRSGHGILFSLFTITSILVMDQKAPNQAKISQELIKMVSITLEKLWMFSDNIVDFRFFGKFHRTCDNFSVFELSRSMLVMHQKSS